MKCRSSGPTLFSGSLVDFATIVAGSFLRRSASDIPILAVKDRTINCTLPVMATWFTMLPRRMPETPGEGAPLMYNELRAHFHRHDSDDLSVREPAPSSLAITLLVALVLVLATRWPVSRPAPLESDEFGFLEAIQDHWFPMHHTLFLTGARAIGETIGDLYRGFVVLDMLMSAFALTSAWWWLRALVPPLPAAAGACALGAAPLFWGYGAMAGNYTAIIAVGCFLLGIAHRARVSPSAWQPFAAAVALALGAGYRQDIGTFWLPVFLVILWAHRWRRAAGAAIIFALINLAWFSAMLQDCGGWAAYRAKTAEFAYHAGYLNSVWSLGLLDAPVRYSVKLGMALIWTLGPGLLFVPRGIQRLRQIRNGGFLAAILLLSVVLPLGSHLLVHFGVQGYAFHYVPALLALFVLGVGGKGDWETSGATLPRPGKRPATTTRRLLAGSSLMAAVFLFYPTNYSHPGWRGNFDLSFARHTRVGLRTPLPDHQPAVWRTANSRVAQGSGAGQHPPLPRSL